MKTLSLCALAVSLAGCTENAPVKPVKTRASRVADAETVVSKTPVPRTYRINGNELLVIDVPTRDSLGFVENQKCFVWRDAEYKSASMQCPAGSADLQLPSAP